MLLSVRNKIVTKTLADSPAGQQVEDLLQRPQKEDSEWSFEKD